MYSPGFFQSYSRKGTTLVEPFYQYIVRQYMQCTGERAGHGVDNHETYITSNGTIDDGFNP